MNKSFIITIIHLLTLCNLKAQNSGVNFESGSWEEVLNEAKRQHKAIFVDCFTTWCGPCKRMDRDVYNDSIVGKYINSKFVSVKLQMDRTALDSIINQSWDKVVKKFESKYLIDAYPTFLFFSYDEELLYKEVGFKNADEFINLAKDAQDVTKQYSKRIANYKEGKIKKEDLPELAYLAGRFGDEKLVLKIGQDYKAHYLDKLSDEDLLASKKDIKFLLANDQILNSNDRFFNWCLHSPEKVDSSNKKKIKQLIASVIYREELLNKIWSNDSVLITNPNWDSLSLVISNKYGPEYSKQLVQQQETYYYYRLRNWEEFAKVIDTKIKDNPPQYGDYMLAIMLNNQAWLLFNESKDPIVLKKAINWVNFSINIVDDEFKQRKNFYDTRANLLYKLGKTKNAVIDEKKALDLSEKHSDDDTTLYKKNITKMKMGKPTWE